MHLVVTDSGLGGLTICAALERALSGRTAAAHLTYVNAWPETGRGYNDLPDLPARARMFDRVLARIATLEPDVILVACNTLSIVYEHTAFRTAGTTPVQGIVDSGVELFLDAIREHPASAIVITGTRTTVESGVHAARLADRGVARERIAGASCHGLATAIERGPDSEATAALLTTCAERAAAAAPQGDPLLLGLACTHYAIVGARFAAELGAKTGRTVLPLDPNARMVSDVLKAEASGFRGQGAGHRAQGAGCRGRGVEVISKVELSSSQRESIAGVIAPVSAATADALRGYTHLPDFF